MSKEQQLLLRSEPIWHPSRWQGLQALDAFIPRIAAYAEERNYDHGLESVVSRLSPYIRHRLVTEREIITAVCRQYPYGTAAKFIEEICWRTYWKGWLEQHPAVWSNYNRKRASAVAELTPAEYARYQKALIGETGIECFDVWINELFHSGYLHNHTRMWFASIWIFTLRLPWELGAQLFHQHLLDGDPACNTLSWRWVAGLFTRGKHYLARSDNIAKYTSGRFAATPELNVTATALSDADPVQRVNLRRTTQFKPDVLPSLSDSPAGLLITPEDLSPEIGGLAECPFNAIGLFFADEIDEQHSFSPAVRAFRSGALVDAAKRAGAHWNLEPHVEKTRNWTESVCDWARRERLKAVRLNETPVGPWRERIPRLKAALCRQGVQLLEHRADWDQLQWPHSVGGYFQFKRGLQQRIESLRIVTAR